MKLQRVCKQESSLFGKAQQGLIFFLEFEYLLKLKWSMHQIYWTGNDEPFENSPALWGRKHFIKGQFIKGHALLGSWCFSKEVVK